MKSWNLTVSDFCNSSSSSGRKQRVELAGPSHSGRDISSTLKENFVFGLKTLKLKVTQSFAFLALNIGIICKSYAHLNKQSLGHRKKCQIHWALNFNIHRVPKYHTKNYWNQHKWLVIRFKKDKCVLRACLCHCASMCWEGDSFIERDSVLFVFLVFFIIVMGYLSTG